jgi:polyisoprenoid-binding protein YceI
MTAQSLATLTGSYAIDPAHSRIGFVARHAMVTKVRGAFDTFEGTAHLDFEQPERSSAEITIDVASVNTRNAQRDDHLRTNDFFDAPNHPKASFRSTSVRKIDDETYELIGDLTLKGTTKPVTVEFEYSGTEKDPFGNVRVGFEGKTTINRRDWGVEWNAALESGGVLVSEKITLEFEVSAVKTEPQQA